MSPEKFKEESSPWELNEEKKKRENTSIILFHFLVCQDMQPRSYTPTAFNAMVNNTFTNHDREQSFLSQVVGYLFTAMRESKQTKPNSSTLISLTRKCLTNSRHCDGILTLVQIP